MMTFLKRRAGSLALRGIALGRRLPWMARLYRLLPARLKLGLRRRLAFAAGGVSGSRRQTFDESEVATAPAKAAFEHPLSQVAHPDGVNLIGYVSGQFGIAENVRSYARALAMRNMPFSLLDLGVAFPANSGDRSMQGLVSDRPVHPFNLHLYNADQVGVAREALGDGVFEGHYNIGFWLWELSRFPQAWATATASYDEFWVPSDFVHDSLVQITDKRVVKIPKAIEFKPPSSLSREYFGLDPTAFTFLFSYDCHSFPERKNPQAVIAAFKQAFPRTRKDVRLVIKSSHGDRYPDHLADIVSAIAGDFRIRMWDEVMRRDEMYALLASVDSYVSLHRSEGFGLGMAEAMYLGKCVVATGYSGNMDFMSESTACIVDYDLVEVKPGQYPHAQGQVWAEPRVDHAARYMRLLADDPEHAANIGSMAAAYIRAGYSREHAADAIRTRIQAINAIRRRKVGN